MKNYFAAVSLGVLTLACRVCPAEVPPVPARVLHTSDIADLVRFSPSGKLLAIETESEPLSSDMTRSIELWDTATWQRLRIFRSSQSYLNFDCFFSSDSRMLFTSSISRVEQWDLASQNMNIYGGGGFFAISQDRRFFAGRSFQNTEQSVGLHQKRLTAWVRIVDTLQHRLTTAIILPPAFYNCTDGVFSPDGSILAVDGDNQGESLTLWDTKTGTQITNLGNGAAGAEHSAFSPDGKMFAAAGPGLPLTFWNTLAWNKTRSCPLSLNCTDEMSFSATGKCLFISGDDGTGTSGLGHTLTLWNVGLGKIIQRVPHQYGAKFSDDGSLLTTEGAKTVTLWNAETGKKVSEYSSQNDYRLSFALSPDNHVLAATTSHSREVSIWNVPSR